MTDYKFPTDHEFRKKAAYIADKVMYAINVHKVNLGCSYNNYCPLQCLNLKTYGFPSAHMAAKNSKGILNDRECASFIGGYDGYRYEDNSFYDEPMFRLGRAYRAKYRK